MAGVERATQARCINPMPSFTNLLCHESHCVWYSSVYYRVPSLSAAVRVQGGP